MLHYLLIYLVICVISALLGIGLHGMRPRLFTALGVLVYLGIAVVLVSLPLGDGNLRNWFLDARFRSMYLASFGLFGVIPLASLTMSLRSFLTERRAAGVVLLLIPLTLWGIAVDAWFLEPEWLEITHRRITSAKIKRPLRIAIIADIQTDHVGEYERSVLEKTKAENPDLVLFAGDYIQCFGEDEYLAECGKFRSLLQEVSLAPPLGTFAVGGNVDAYRGKGSDYEPLWVSIFHNSSVQAVDPTVLHDLGPVWLTALNVWDSSSVIKLVPKAPDAKFHIALGHLPNFALAHYKRDRLQPEDADLFIAGHVHGGQIRLPWLGPITTNSALSRKWAVGLTEMAPGKHLLVSRGIGLERSWAPRVRFLCRPELCILDVVPAQGAP